MNTIQHKYKENGLCFFKEHLILGKHKGFIYSIPLFRVWEDAFIQTYDLTSEVTK